MGGFTRVMLIAGAFLTALAVQADPDTRARTEIAHLLAHLGNSGCDFYRNGNWYVSTRARAHLQKKYDYLLRKNLVDSAEQFIERAATQSSRTGDAYQVRCSDANALPSSQWLTSELIRFRAGTTRD